MGKMKGSQALFIVVVMLMLGWIFSSLYHLFHTTSEQQNGSHLLYQIALFQIEMLNSSLADITNLKSTQQLVAIKQAAYSVDYTHERFLISLGSNKTVALFSLKRMMDYILRLQIGGDRSLKPEETQVFVNTGILFKKLYEEYAKLMVNPYNRIIASQNAKIHKLDQDLADIFSRKLLQ
jgi:hypothetical protein